MSNHDILYRHSNKRTWHTHAYALNFSCCTSTSLQTADMTDLKMRPRISINACLAQQVEWAAVEWAEVEWAMLRVSHQCTDWHIRPDVSPCVQQGINTVHIASQGWPMSLTPYWLALFAMHMAHTYCKVLLWVKLIVSPASKPHLCICVCSCMS